MNGTTLALLVTAWLVGMAVAQHANATASWAPAAADDEPEQLPTWYETLQITMDPTTFETGTLPGDLAAANERAFLDTIAAAEGTLGRGDNGYNIRFGGATFASYADHPRIFTPFTDGAGRNLVSSAAGRYQFIVRTWDELAQQLELPDFGPASQDTAALELVRRRGALADVHAGRFADAVRKCAPVWASFPGAGYQQPERQLSFLAAAFTGAGGTVTT